MHAQIVQHVFCVLFWKVQIYCCGSTYDYLLLASRALLGGVILGNLRLAGLYIR